MKHSLILPTAVLLFAASLAAALPDLALQPARVITGLGPDHVKGSRGAQGVPAIERTAEGRLWAAWYAGKSKRGVESPSSYVVLATSSDEGTTRTEKMVLQAPRLCHTYDPCLWIDPAGKLWFFWAQSAGLQDGRMGVWSMTTEQPGRLGGVNWIMALRLIVYHSILSIFIPIVMAKRLPREPFQLRDGPRVSRWWFFLIGLLAPIGYVVFGFKIPSDGQISAWAALLLLAGFAGLILWLVMKLSGNCGAWKARQRLALASGVLMFSTILMIINEQNDGSKRLVGLAGLIFVIMMARQARRAEQWEAITAPRQDGR